jgi:hypothetical protein
MKGCMENDAKCQKLFYEKYLPYALRISTVMCILLITPRLLPTMLL